MVDTDRLIGDDLRHRDPRFGGVAGAPMLNNGSSGLNASSADAPGRRSMSEPYVV
jgi:hypothetical protein